jgi:hypothetical protein
VPAKGAAIDPASFDASTFEIWFRLLNGGCLVIRTDAGYARNQCLLVTFGRTPGLRGGHHAVHHGLFAMALGMKAMTLIDFFAT